MTPRDFVYWLNGFIELNPGLMSITEKQINIIRAHLALVMKNETSKVVPPVSQPEHITVDDVPAYTGYQHEPDDSYLDLFEMPVNTTRLCSSLYWDTHTKPAC